MYLRRKKKILYTIGHSHFPYPDSATTMASLKSKAHAKSGLN